MTDKPQTEFKSVIEKRRSTRKFEPGREVAREVLDRIVDCGRWAPSGANSQCWDFKSQYRRYRRPLEQVRHWNRYQLTQYRPHAMVDFYGSTIRPFTMYRDREDLRDWPDFQSRMGKWAEAFTTAHPNPDGELEPEADFSKPRTAGPATKARRQR